MNKYFLLVLCLLFTFLSKQSFAQERNLILEGYVFEENNSGYLNEVKITVLDAENSMLYGNPTTNIEGYFAVEVPADRDFIIRASKAAFKPYETAATSKTLEEGKSKVYVKMPMERAPGYRLEVTLAEERTKDNTNEVDAISNSLIEVYNNTKGKEILNLKNHPSPYFSFQLEQGNHYTLLIRSPGYFTKRIESFVNVDGCILCMDGVSEIGPGVSDNLAYGNEMGTLLANIELQPMRLDSAIKLKNIYYTYNSFKIQPQAAFELDKVVEMLKVNPSVVVELGSHTDSRGKSAYNRTLSQKRAQSAVDYIESKGIKRRRLSAKGYGEDKPVNMCIDGVDCSEDEHAINRRTELKITGFTNDPFAGKPLVDIIADENLESLLKDVLDQDEYVVPNGSTASAPVNKNPLDKMNGDLAKTKPAINPNSPEATASSKKPSTTDINKAEKPSKSPLKVIVADQPVSNSKALQTANGTKFSGYRILVFQSPVSLADDNGELFFKYGTLKEEVLADKTFGYMSGAYGSEVEAKSYLNNVSTLFPKARILRYVNGFIIDNLN